MIQAPYLFSKEVERLLAAEPEEDRIYALHGTSTGAIRFLARNGTFPQTGTCGGEFYLMAEKPGVCTKTVEEFSYMYAKWNQEKLFLRHYFGKLGFYPDLNDLMYICEDYDLLEKIITQARELGISRRQITRQMNAMDKAGLKGILLTFSSSIATDFEVHDGGDDVYIVPGETLLLPYILGIEPLGNIEWEEVQRIINGAPPKLPFLDFVSR